MTGGKVHATDHSNASRTMLLNLQNHDWDPHLLELFNIPPHLMPEVKPSLGLFGYTDPSFLGAEILIMSVLGDQQAALFGHGCDSPGALKCTYGTGAFLVTHTGTEIVRTKHELLSTIAWSEAHGNETKFGYAIEGAMFTAGPAFSGCGMVSG